MIGSGVDLGGAAGKAVILLEVCLRQRCTRIAGPTWSFTLDHLLSLPLHLLRIIIITVTFLSHKEKLPLEFL